MKAVNLIPPEERRGDRAPLRTGSLPYALVGALALALVGMTLVVTTQNTIADRKAEVATLQQQEADAKARATSLASYADLATLQQARTQTVTSLAESRFDWDRVLRELALVIPQNVQITNLSGSVSPGTEAAGGTTSGGDLGAGITGPSLSMSGCATGHIAVAGFITAVKEIDGVTRVGVSNSSRSDGTSGASSTASGAGGCSGGNIATFNLVAAFDAVPIDPTTQAPVPPAAEAPSVAPDPQVADGQQQEAAARRSEQQQTDKAHHAVDTLIPGTVTK